MNIKRTWLWIGGAALGAAAALAAGVSLSTLLIVAALLACPVVMSLGMRGMHQGSGAQGTGGMAGCAPGMHDSEKARPDAEPVSAGPRQASEPARRS